MNEDADDQLSEIATSIPPVDPSCVELKHSAFLAQMLLEEIDVESTSEPCWETCAAHAAYVLR